MGVNKNSCSYVFCSPTSCPYKERIRASRAAASDRLLDKFNSCARRYRRNMLDIDALEECCTALESYIISDIESVCAAYSGREWVLGVKYVIPSEADYFESDRLCTKLGPKKAVLSEDLDCVALFGLDFMIKEVYRSFFSYMTVTDIIDCFNSANRRDLVHRCCIMGTHFNLGLKGIGPVRVKKLSPGKAEDMFKSCLALQSIDPKDFYKFVMLT